MGEVEELVEFGIYCENRADWIAYGLGLECEGKWNQGQLKL